MGKGLRTVVGFGVVGAALLLVAGAMVLSRQPWKQTARLPGGHMLTLVGATYGKHRVELEEWWQKLLRPVVPQIPPARTFEASLDPRVYPDPLFLWFDNAEAAKLKRGRLTRVLALDPEAAALLPWPEVTDEQGDSLGPLPMSRLHGHQTPSEVVTLPLVAFPRRGKQVRVRFFRRSPRIVLAEFVVPNPDPGPHPEWTPEPFPIRQRAGDLECTLLKLVTGLNRAGRKAGAGTPTRTELLLQLTREDKPATEWEPLQVTLADATGNRFTPEEGVFSRRGSEYLLKVPAALSPRERAWKLRVELARSARAEFAAHETWTVRGVPIPRTKDTPGLGGRVGGVQLRLAEIAVPEKDRRRVRVRLTAKGKLEGRRLTLLARDERGRAFPGQGTSDAGREQLRGPVCDFFVKPAPDSRVLDLTFAVQQSRYVEFLAKPRVP